jgi:acyl dehydratase
MKMIDAGYLKNNIGSHIASSPWFLVEQSLINGFADVTGDKQWIHLDTVRAEKESPYKATIAHGYLLISLIPQFAQQSYNIEGVTTKINYGLNKVRFLQAVKPGQKIQANFFIEKFQEIENGDFKLEVRVEIETAPNKQLVCVANTVVLCIS